MQFKKAIKKGFTLVELVVVIAVIAILAATSVGIYFGVTESAKKSNDQTVTNQMNKALMLDATLNGNPNSPSEALAVLEENGFDVTKMTPFQDGAYYLWDSQENEMILINSEGTVDFPADTEIRTNEKFDYYGFVSSQEEINSNPDYSYYLKSSYDEDAVKVNASVDTGTNDDIKTVTYENKTSTRKSVSIFTNSYDTSIILDGKAGNEGDDVSTYGSSDSIKVNSVGLNSLHVYGDVAGNINLVKGRVVTKPGSSVTSIVLEGEADEVKVLLESGSSVNNIVAEDMSKYASSDIVNNVNANQSGYTFVSDYNGLKDAIENGTNGLIYLNKDIEYPQNAVANGELLNIKRSLTIDGNGHNITGNGVRGSNKPTIVLNHGGEEWINVALLNMHIQNNSIGNAARGIETRGKVSSLKLSNVHVIAPNGNTQPITIGGSQAETLDLDIVKSTINLGHEGTGYGIITFNPVDLDVVDSTFKGFSAIYLKGIDNSAGSTGSTIYLERTSLVTEGSKNPTDNFGSISIEASNVSVELNNCQTIASEEKGGSNQSLFNISFENYNVSDLGSFTSVDQLVKGFKAKIYGDSTLMLGKIAQTNFENIKISEIASIEITGGSFSVDPSEFVPSTGYEVTRGEFYTVTRD